MKSRLAVVLSMSLAAACGSSSAVSTGGRGAVEIVAVTSAALSRSDIERVALTITGDGIAPDIEQSLAHVGTKWQGVIGGIPAGTDRTFDADAIGPADAVLYRNHTPGITITAGATTSLALVLQQAQSADPFHNSAPQITAVSASSASVAPLGTITLSSFAVDVDGDVLTYEWSSLTGAFGTGGATTTTWTAPGTPGAATLTLRVRDTKGASAAISFDVQVSGTGGTGSASIAASFNDAPSVGSITTDRSPIAAGDVAHLAVTATDLDADAITYAWSSTCAGIFDAPTTATPAFTLGAVDAGTTSCGFTVKVSDTHDAFNTGTLSIPVGSAATLPPPPPIVDTTFQPATTADGGATLPFRVKGHDPLGGAVTYAWSASSGTLGTAALASGESSVVWTAPACITADATISVVLATASGASTTQTFTVTPGAISGCATATRVSVSTAGADADDSSNRPAVSDDGRYVAFGSSATNLTTESPGPGAPVGTVNIFLRDTVAGTTTLLSRSPDGLTGGNQYSRYPSISRDGRYVSFASNATNLVVGSVYGGIFVYDRITAALLRIASRQGTDGVDYPRISGDGSHVAYSDFGPPADGKSYVADLTGARQLLANKGGGGFAMSNTGRYVAFSTIHKLLPADVSLYSHDVYLRDMVTDQLSLVSTGASFPGRNVGDDTAVSDDGNLVAYLTNEKLDPLHDTDDLLDLYVHDVAAGTDRLASHGDGTGASYPWLSADGSLVAFQDVYVVEAGSIFVRNLQTNAIVLQALLPSGQPASAYEPMLSANGAYIAFSSSSYGLAPASTSASPSVHHAYVAPRR